jgi:hypothetical protein
MRIACFDIGIINFAFYIEEIDPLYLSQLKTIKNKYNPNGTPTQEFEFILNDIYTHGKHVFSDVIELSCSKVNPYAISTDVISSLTRYLKENMELWNTCSCFIIEKQMTFKKAHNSNAERLSQHCFSFFEIMYGNKKCISFIGASRKTKVLGCPLQLNAKKKYESLPKPQRKKWSVNNALHVLYMRKDYDSISHFIQYHKKDDIADCINLLQSFKYLVFVEKKFNSN